MNPILQCQYYVFEKPCRLESKSFRHALLNIFSPNICELLDVPPTAHTQGLKRNHVVLVCRGIGCSRWMRSGINYSQLCMVIVPNVSRQQDVEKVVVCEQQ